MRKLISCEYNIDTACVELKYSDGGELFVSSYDYLANDR